MTTARDLLIVALSAASGRAAEPGDLSLALAGAELLDLMDARATTFDDAEPHPLAGRIDAYLADLPWVAAVGSRVRDEGHVFHVESFIVPADDRMPTLDELEAAREGCVELDWKVQDIVLVPVRELPIVVPVTESPG